MRPTRSLIIADLAGNRTPFGLAPGGVYRAIKVAFYAGALLPHRFTIAISGCLLSVALSFRSP